MPPLRDSTATGPSTGAGICNGLTVKIWINATMNPVIIILVWKHDSQLKPSASRRILALPSPPCPTVV